MIIIERSRFAQLIRSYRKALYMNALLEYICREQNRPLTFTSEEICEILNLPKDEITRRIFRGRLRFDEVDGIRYFDLMDLVNLKDSLDSQTIFRQTMDGAVPDTAIRIEEMK